MKNLILLLVLFYASVVFGRDTPTDTVRYKTQSSDASTPSSGYINNYFLTSDEFPYFRNSSGTINGYMYAASALTANGILYGNGTRSPSVLSACSDNSVLVGNTSSAPSCRQINGNDIVATASIPYSKLNLTGSILTADIADAELSAIGGVTSSPDKIPYFTSTGSAGLVTIGTGLSFSSGTLSAAAASSWTSISDSAMTRVTGAAPDALGEYRSYIRGASGFTWSETNGEPAVAPSSSDGILIYATGNGSGYGTADTNNHPSFYEIYIGTNKQFMIRGYSTTGKTGYCDMRPHYIGTTLLRGVAVSYDPSTGVVAIQQTFEPSGITGTAIGIAMGSGGNNVTNCYFELFYQ